MVNVNVCTTAFYEEGNLAEGMRTFAAASFGANMATFVKSLRVNTIHLGYRKTIKRLGKQTPRQHKFQCDEMGGMVTVEVYFKKSKPPISH